MRSSRFLNTKPQDDASASDEILTPLDTERARGGEGEKKERGKKAQDDGIFKH